MKETWKKGLSVAGTVLGLALLALVIFRGDGLPGWANGLLAGLGGASLGLGGGGVVMEGAARRMTPKERAELERSETDERNIAIREKAAQDSWYWTSALLWIPFVVALVRQDPVFIPVSLGVLAFHHAFYIFHMGRWLKRM